MAYEVIFTTIARNDLNDTVGYIADELCNASAAERLTLEIYNNIQNISEFPRIGRQFDEFFTPQPLRWVLASSYMIVYNIDEENKVVYIVRIVGAKRDLDALFEENDQT